MDLTFAQVSRALARSHGISESKNSAFVARLQHLQKLKFPPGTNTGRGRAAKYSVGHLFQLGMVLELAQIGLTPERAMRIVGGERDIVAEAAQMVARDGPTDAQYEQPVVIICDPAALSSAMSADPEDAAEVSFMRWRIDDALGWAREEFARGARRGAIFSVSAMFRSAAACACDEIFDERAFYDELGKWADSELGARQHVADWRAKVHGLGDG